MSDKVITTINLAVKNDTAMGLLLAKDQFGEPAVYDTWGSGKYKFPYIVHLWKFYPANHYAKRNGNLEAHIFTKGSSSIEAESIRNREVEILDKQYFESDESGLIRCYLLNDMPMEEDEAVVHWWAAFDVIFWRKEFIRNLTI